MAVQMINGHFFMTEKFNNCILVNYIISHSPLIIEKKNNGTCLPGPVHLVIFHNCKCF